MKAWIGKALDAAAVGESERQARRAVRHDRQMGRLREYRLRQKTVESGKLAELPKHSPLRRKLELERLAV